MAGVKQPTDKSHFLLPDLGEGLAEAELVSWKVAAGDTVKESQTLAEMQTDKALVEVPSPWAGTVSELCGKAGDVIKVAEVVRDLFRRDLDRGLSAGEKRMLAKARAILISELALAENTDEAKAESILDEVLAS